MIFKPHEKYTDMVTGTVYTYSGYDSSKQGFCFAHPVDSKQNFYFSDLHYAKDYFVEAAAQPVKKDLKYDQDKPRMALLTGGFPNALEEVGKVLTFGAQKYEAHSWQTVDNGRERYESALMRHLLAPHKGEDTDPESGLLHLTHAAFNALAILEIELRKQKQQ